MSFQTAATFFVVLGMVYTLVATCILWYRFKQTKKEKKKIRFGRRY
jgi:hypothetical protein